MANRYGICALCGKECKLTYEHIPPQKAFNSKSAQMYPGSKILFDNDRLPWDVKGLKYKILQKGSGKYSLCNECNNNTGSWYADTYKDVAHVIAQVLLKSKEEEITGIKIEGIYGARFLKQILSMFCSINNHESLQIHLNQPIEDYEYGQSALAKTIIETKYGLKCAAMLMDYIRRFVLERDSVCLDKSKFKICMYVTDSEISKFSSLSAVMNLNSNDFAVVSEITAWPLGFILYFNPHKNLKFEGVDITALSDLKYDDKVNIEFPLVVKEMNTVLPLDYRSKEQIEVDSRKNDWS